MRRVGWTSDGAQDRSAGDARAATCGAWQARLTLAAALFVAGCGPGAGGHDGPTVFAAASLTDVAERLVGDAGRVSVGASSALARQVLDGAPADVFVSASSAWVEAVVAGGFARGEPLLVARNRLVCVAPINGALTDLRDLDALVARLADDARVAIADDGVPAGEYVRQSLAATGHLESLRTRLVGQSDVRGVLAAVGGGHVDVGFVYDTDAVASDRVVVLFTLDAATHDAVEIMGVALTEAGEDVLASWCAPAGRRVLREAGFEVDDE